MFSNGLPRYISLCRSGCSDTIIDFCIRDFRREILVSRGMLGNVILPPLTSGDGDSTWRRIVSEGSDDAGNWAGIGDADESESEDSICRRCGRDDAGNRVGIGGPDESESEDAICG